MFKRNPIWTIFSIKLHKNSLKITWVKVVRQKSKIKYSRGCHTIVGKVQIPIQVFIYNNLVISLHTVYLLIQYSAYRGRQQTCRMNEKTCRITVFLINVCLSAWVPFLNLSKINVIVYVIVPFNVCNYEIEAEL